MCTSNYLRRRCFKVLPQKGAYYAGLQRHRLPPCEFKLQNIHVKKKMVIQSKSSVPEPSDDIYLFRRLWKQDSVVADDSDRITKYSWKSWGVSKNNENDENELWEWRMCCFLEMKRCCFTNLWQVCLRKKPWIHQIYCRLQFWQWPES